MNITATLTRRERQIAEFIAWGAAKKEIADSLSISQNTVNNIARSIYEKVGIQKSTELSVWYFCTHFHISFDLSPVKRQLVAIVFILILLPADFTAIRPMRARSGRRARTECRARRRKDDASCFSFLDYQSY